LDSTRVRPDLVLVAIGADPDDGIASAAGLVTGNGVHTDARLRTSDPHVHAAGDIANHHHPDLGRLRVEHWDNAIAQGRHAARSMLGDPAPYDRLPYFFTDQYDLGMEYVGHVAKADRPEVVIRGDVEKRVVTAFFVTGGRVAAGLHLNDWDAVDHLRRIVGQPFDPRLQDPEIDLGDIG
jgi:NADPH-dependent 2,4-dienoyl-CoA reductase/sulfur reductase-like enzyme